MKSQIAKRKSNLPAKPAELRKWILIGKVKLRAQIAAIKAIKSIEEASAATQAALEDTQDLAEELLYAEAQMGAMLESMPQKRDKRKTSVGGSLPSRPANITDKDSHYAQQLSKNEVVIAEVVAEAREKGEVPVRHHVLRKIKANAPKPKKTPLPQGKYDIIYADPAWQYANSGLMGAASEHYQTMSTDVICEMKIAKVSGKDAVLFLWATNPLLEDAMRVIDAWGFSYKTNFCWVKGGRGTYGKLGFYVSGGHELLLLATRGSMLPDGEKPSSVIQATKTKHSKKPECVYGIIEQMYPDGNYLELFARNAQPRKKWTYWGNEA